MLMTLSFGFKNQKIQNIRSNNQIAKQSKIKNAHDKRLLFYENKKIKEIVDQMVALIASI